MDNTFMLPGQPACKGVPDFKGNKEVDLVPFHQRVWEM